MKCKICQQDVPTGKLKCTSCGAINLPNQVISSVSGSPIEDGSVLLSDVKSAEMDRIDVGFMNMIFGGPVLDPEDENCLEYGPGLVTDSVYLIGGMPGAGKSTLALQLLDHIASCIPEKECLYIGTEESLPQIRSRADRLKIKNQNRIRMVSGMTGGIDIGSVLMHRKPSVTVIDSLQGLVGEDDNASVEICKSAKQYAMTLKSPIIITQHVTKGLEIAGVQTIQHEVDGVMLFLPNENNEDIRELEVNPKNRFGRAYIKMYFEMGANGLEPLPLDFDPDDLLEE